jgi:acetyl-CoA synthetase
MSTLFGQDALEHRIRDATIPVAVVDDTESFRPLLDTETPLDQLVTIRPDAAEGTRRTDNVPFEEAVSLGTPIETVRTAAEDNAILLYTSGTTGDPKPALHVHRYLLNNLPGFLTATCNLDLRDDDVLWTPAEWAWFATLFCVLLPGLYYGKRVLAYDGGAFDPAVALDLIEEAPVTQFVAPPTAIRKIKGVDEGTVDLSSLRTITCGAHDEEIASWVDERLTDTVIHENYGQTEAGVLIAECTALQDTAPGCMGMAVPGYDLELLDPATGESLSDDVDAGELAVQIGDRPICFKQYWNRPKITEETLVDDRLLTGDLVQRAGDDTFTFEGRQDYLIISAGHSIGPQEVEQCLLDHPAVAEVGVIGVTDPERGEVPKAYVELAPEWEGNDELVRTLQNHVRERLAKYKYPRDVTFLSELPMQRGKVQRDKLRQLAPGNQDGSPSHDS